MTQSRALSALEAATNVITGWVVALITQALVFPVFGLQAMLWQSLALNGVFGAVSMVRRTVLGRVFVWQAR